MAAAERETHNAPTRSGGAIAAAAWLTMCSMIAAGSVAALAWPGQAELTTNLARGDVVVDGRPVTTLDSIGRATVGLGFGTSIVEVRCGSIVVATFHVSSRRAPVVPLEVRVGPGLASGCLAPAVASGEADTPLPTPPTPPEPVAPAPTDAGVAQTAAPAPSVPDAGSTLWSRCVGTYRGSIGDGCSLTLRVFPEPDEDGQLASLTYCDGAPSRYRSTSQVDAGVELRFRGPDGSPWTISLPCDLGPDEVVRGRTPYESARFRRVRP